MGASILREAPEGWRRIDLKATMATTVEDLALTVIMSDGSSPRLEPPDGVNSTLRELRQITYEPGIGAWFAMRLVLDPPGSYVVHYNYDFDPLWEPPVPPAVYRQDLEAFPRNAEHIPAWYHKRMEESSEETERV